LINLLANAVKFTPEDGQIRVSSFPTKGGLAITVGDRGIGMASEDIARVMTIFGQVDSKISRKHEGTGLGLPLAKHLIELHGGSLTVNSKVDVGTTVTLVLPPERIVQEPRFRPRGRGESDARNADAHGSAATSIAARQVNSTKR
jgi:signal transduction histidine kinase